MLHARPGQGGYYVGVDNQRPVSSVGFVEARPTDGLPSPLVCDERGFDWGEPDRAPHKQESCVRNIFWYTVHVLIYRKVLITALP